VDEQTMHIAQRRRLLRNTQQNAIGVFDDLKFHIRPQGKALAQFFGHDNPSRFVNGNSHVI
jgi:hypothetical protein